MNSHINNKGLTLIEVVVSLAIIGVLLMTYLTTFTTGATNIFFAGHRTENVFKAQDKIDSIIQDINNGSGDPKVNIKSSTIQLRLYSSDGSNSMTTSTIAGKEVGVTDGDKRPITLTTFIPDGW